MLKMTIAMPVVDNYSQLRSTIQDIRRHNREACKNVEFVVVDNKPSTPGAQRIKTFIQGWVTGAGNLGAKYVPMSEPVGTAPAKQRCIDEASGDVIVVMDSHVFLEAGWVQKLFDFYQRTGRTKNLYTGPLLYDDLGYKTRGQSHFDAYWRSEMWGVWGNAWACPCRRPYDENSKGLIFSYNGVKTEDANHQFYALSREQLVPVTRCGDCGRALPEIKKQKNCSLTLREMSYHALGTDKRHAPFEIPAMGMGFFTCWKDAWPGFNPNFVGFGGEELYIHHKLAANGGKCICLPEFQWDHEFSDPKLEPVKYLASHYHTMRNYVIGFQELGRDIQEIHDHFVDGHKTTEETWQYLLQDPIAHSSPTKAKADKGPLNSQPPASLSTLVELYQWTAAQPRDLADHMDTLRRFSESANVLEITKHRESTVAIATGNPLRLTTLTSAAEPLIGRVTRLMGTKHTVIEEKAHSPLQPPNDADVLFLNATATSEWLTQQLDLSAGVRRAVIIHGVRMFGDIGEDGKPGLFTSIGKFLGDNPEWAVVQVNPSKHGMCVLAKPDVVGLRAQPAPFWNPTVGPGSRLTEMLSKIGVTDKPGCDCKKKAGLMDVWGVKGCRIHYTTLLSWLEEGQSRWSWAEKLRAAAGAVTSGIAFQLDPLNPIKSMLDIAIGDE